MAKRQAKPKTDVTGVDNEKAHATDLRSGMTREEAEKMAAADPASLNHRVDEPRPLTDFAVQPVAPEEDEQAVDPYTGTASWAINAFCRDRAVRRASWAGAKTLDPSHHEPRIILHRDDLLARDWVFA